jgi:hypothetical protein
MGIMPRPVRLLVTALCADKGGDIEFGSVLLDLFELEISAARLAAQCGWWVNGCAHGTSLVGHGEQPTVLDAMDQLARLGLR